MTTSTPEISLFNLSFAFLLLIPVLVFLFAWQLRYKTALYAIARMLGQLLIIGYFLAFIFETEYLAIIVAVLAVMALVSSWISLEAVALQRRELYLCAFGSVTFAALINLTVVTQGVLNLDPWYEPRFFLPLAGMIFSSAMNSVSLAAERMRAELKAGAAFEAARATAFNASLIPITNSMFAVGIVTLPGMMTGQILGGVSPLIAVRYQIMVMCMMFGTAGIAAACFLILSKKSLLDLKTSAV